MKKCFLVTVLITLLISLLPINAAESPSISITGSDSTHHGEFILMEVHVDGDKVTNITGKITYEKNDLAIFDLVQTTELPNWDITIDTATAGTVSFSAKANSKAVETDFISVDTVLFKMRFIVKSDDITSAKIATSKVTSVVKEMVVDKSNILNKEEIDYAKKYHKDLEKWPIDLPNKPDPIPVPDPIYGEKEVEKTLNLDNSTLKVAVSKKLSSNSYLSAVTVANGTINPSFNKLTNIYTIDVEGSEKVSMNAVAEYPNSVVSISEETNNQIVVSVTSETGIISSYVFNVARTEKDPAGNEQKATPGKTEKTSFIDRISNSLGIKLTLVNNTMLLLLGALSLISLVIIGIGRYYVYVGSHEEVED